jgi:nucleoside phosphorylase
VFIQLLALPTLASGAVREGRIVTGSVFVDVPAKKVLVEMLAAAGLGAPEAVEMECAGVAQVRTI